MIPRTIRLDVLPEYDTAGMLTKFLDKYEKYLVYREISDVMNKEHYQGILWISDEKAASAMKTRWSTVFKDWSRGQKSCAVVRLDSYETYITKDKNRFIMKGYSDEEITDLESRSYTKSPSPSHKVLAERTKSTETTFMKAYRWCLEKGMSDAWTGWQICSLLLQYYLEHVKCEPNDFQLKCMTKSLYKQMILDKSKRLNNPAILTNYLNNRSKQIIGCDWVVE